MRRIFLITLCFVITSFVSPPRAQVIWSEDFTYTEGTMTGANNNPANPANDWTSNCPGCLSGDWFEVRNNEMEGHDTNGPAVLETEVIDISAFPSGIEFSVYFAELGALDGCPGGNSCGCNCIDWIRVEYNVDGAGYQDAFHANGGACSGSCAGDTYVAIGDFTAFTYVACPLAGDDLQIRISVQTWADGELHRIDNLVVQPTTCGPLPLNGIFTAVDAGDHVALSLYPEAVSGADRFEAERSFDSEQFTRLGRLYETATDKERQKFEYRDLAAYSGPAWYRVKRIFRDGTAEYSEVREVRRTDDRSPGLRLYPNPAGDNVRVLYEGDEIRSVRITDLRGKTLHEAVPAGRREVVMDLSGLAPGVYLVEARTGDGRSGARLIRQ